MTLTELRYIVALHQTAHFGKAAEKCFVSQPTLSVAIKKLEEELDVALFERSRSQVRATPLGEQIIAQAQTVLEQANVINEMANLGKDPLGSTLSIGAIFTIGPYLFPHFVPQLQQSAAKMPLYIEENYTAVLREKLRQGELDAIIIALPFNEPDVVTQSLYEENFVVLLAKDHPLATRKTITAKQLEKEQVLLLGEGHCFRDQVLEACPGLRKHFAAGNDPLQSVVEGSSLETLKYMVASGLGVTILPASAAPLHQDGDGALLTRPFATNSAKRTVALAWRASFPRHQAIDVLSQAIRQCHLGKAVSG
ncbi:hydrogen peroxide-inducible genes activator [Oceanicoccus sagamiensis]|uniref:LysR family transcriptional regulator n=1 Tax=Oceanicoccus sagamiensis TaxID=716816 RepID=A0A1X9NGT5_9GAMM|nr:hydrogen peroxide-inducible genes activator [Oceanicoccus sagamiensis]ARN74157.1 LysR family transcriptional regulator [Oceanicoccus sagamiensis]